MVTPPLKLMFCRRCGGTLVPGSKFCSSCGSSVSSHEQAPVLAKASIPVALGDNKKRPCNFCGSTEYNKVRKCVSSAPIAKGCGKLGCDFCFKRFEIGPKDEYNCPDCTSKKNMRMGILLVVLIGATYVYVEYYMAF